MKAAQIITAIEDFIRQSLHHSYPLLSKEDYAVLTDKKVLHDGRLEVDGNFFQLHSYHNREIECIQIPQTRILLYTAHSEQGRVFIIRLPDILLVALDAIGKEESVSVEAGQGWKTILLDGIIHTKNKSKSLFKTASLGAFILARGSATSELDKIPQLLNKIRINEQKIHPLSFFHVSHKKVMSEIDRLWLQLYPLITADKRINRSRVAEEPGIWLWLQEIYLYFGWYEELETFYNTAGQLNDINQIQLAKHRYRMVSSHAVGDETPGIKKTEKDTFLYFYLFGRQSLQESFLEKVQNKWESISSPARGEYLKQTIQNDAHEFIAFALLARQFNFHWADQAAEKIEGYLEGTVKIVFSLLISLQEEINYFIDDKWIHLQAGKESANRKLLSQTYFEFESTRFGTDYFTGITTNNGPNIQTDKAVMLDISLSQKRIRIKPLLYHPPIDRVEYQHLTISDEQQTIEVPLIWRSFRLKTKKWRIKFLFKKNRFQLSVRLFNKDSGLKIENISVDSSKNYLKLYWPIVKSSANTMFNLCDEKGYRKYALCSALNTFYLRGYAFDRNGLLQEQFNIFLNDSRKSKAIRLNEPKSKGCGIPMVKDIHKIKLTARGCEPSEKLIPKVSGYAERFLSTASLFLKELMIIYMEQNDQKEIEKVKYRVKANLGFWPCVRPIDTIRWERSHFIFILSNTFPSECKLIDDYDLFQIVQPLKMNTVYAFYINKQNEEYLFSEIFFQKMARLESQNKFDFKK